MANLDRLLGASGWYTIRQEVVLALTHNTRLRTVVQQAAILVMIAVIFLLVILTHPLIFIVHSLYHIEFLNNRYLTQHAVFKAKRILYLRFLHMSPDNTEQFCIKYIFTNTCIAELFCAILLTSIAYFVIMFLVIIMELQYAEMGKRIQKRRIQLSIKQNVLAEQLGISNNHLSSIERGKESLSMEVFVSICNILKVTPDYLLMGSMYSNNVSSNIADELRLCSEDDLHLLAHIVQFMVEKRADEWNRDNFV